MKKYRAVVIDGKKIIGKMTAAAIVIAVAVMGFVNIRLADIKVAADTTNRLKSAMGDIIPGLSASNGAGQTIAKSTSAALKKAISFLLTYDPSDPRTAIFGELPLVKVMASTYLGQAAEKQYVLAFNPENADLGQGSADVTASKSGEYPITEVDSGQEKALKGTKNKILIRNETDYGINIDEMLAAPLDFNMRGTSPKVLIVHTHTTECYTPEGATVYSAEKSDRSLNSAENMIAVGEAVRKVFEEKGIAVIHDTTVHDHPSFNGSYANSLKTVEQYKAKYPNLAVVLDLHRDAFVYDDGSKAKFVTEINGQKAAQLMFVVGTNGGGLEHPNWRENMKLALKLQNAIVQKYPSLMRGVNLRKERFNGHTTGGSLIIEVGSSGNTLQEAIYGAKLGAAEIAEFLKGL